MASIAVIGSACGGSATTSRAGDTEAIREAVERRVTDAGPSTRVDDEARPGPELTAEDIAAIYSANGPDVGVTADDIREGDFIALETACDLLVTAVDYDQMLHVYTSFEIWFRGQLAEVGASADYITSWDPAGMLDDLMELGCVPSASPENTDLR